MVEVIRENPELFAFAVACGLCGRAPGRRHFGGLYGDVASRLAEARGRVGAVRMARVRLLARHLAGLVHSGDLDALAAELEWELARVQREFGEVRTGQQDAAARIRRRRRAAWTTHDKQRAKFAYGLVRNRDLPLKTARDRFNAAAQVRGWEPVTSIPEIMDLAKRYAEREGRAPRPARRDK